MTVRQWLDFVNSGDMDAGRLREWARARGLDPGRSGPADAAAVALAGQLHSTLEDLARVTLRGRSPRRPLRGVDAILAFGSGRFRAAHGGARFEPDSGPLMGILVAVARDALAFLGTAELARLRRCRRTGPPCQRLFVDASPAATREYCSPGCAAVERTRRSRARLRSSRP